MRKGEIFSVLCPCCFAELAATITNHSTPSAWARSVLIMTHIRYGCGGNAGGVETKSHFRQAFPQTGMNDDRGPRDSVATLLQADALTGCR